MSLSKFSRKLLLTESVSLKLDDLDVGNFCWVHDVDKEEKHGEIKCQSRVYDDNFFEHLRMSPSTFDCLLNILEVRLTKMTTNFRKPVSAEQRLVITLRFLATGESFRSLASHFCVGKSTVAVIIKETCKAIWEVLQEEYLPYPTREIWLASTETYLQKCDFPNCIGSLDGRHCEIKCPIRSGSKYFNYKKDFSIFLQVVTDANGKFLIVDVGGVCRQSDSGLFRSSSLYKLLEKGELNVPSPHVLPDTDITVPYVIVADEGYPLLPYLMRPFPQRQLDDRKKIFNYRLSQARRSVECGFEILCSKWRVLLKTIETDVKTATLIVKAVCVLHNYILEKEGPNSLYSNIPKEPIPMRFQHRSCQYRFQNSALRVREIFLNYFSGTGAVSWQNHYAKDHPVKAQLNHRVVPTQFKWSTKLSTEMSIEEEETSELVEMATKRNIADFQGSVHSHMLPFKYSPHSVEQATQDLEESPGSSSSKGKCSKRVQKSKSKQVSAQRESKARGIIRGTSNRIGSNCSEGTVVDFPFIHVDMEHFIKEELNCNDLVIKDHDGEDFLNERMNDMDELVVMEEKDVDESLMDEDEFHVKAEDGSLDCVVKEEVEIDERLKEEPGGMPAEDCNGKEIKEWYVEGCTIKQEAEERL